MSETSLPDHKQTPVAAAPAHLLVVGLADAGVEGIQSLLQSAGLASADRAVSGSPLPAVTGADAIGGLDKVAEWLAGRPDAHLVVFAQIPALDVARRMVKGAEPKRAMAQWLESAEQILELVRPRRRRSSVFFAEAALTNPSAFFEVLRQRLGLALDYRSAEDHTPKLPGAVLRMVAENAIWQSNQARSRAAELEATALPVPTARDFLLPAADQVFSEYHKSVDTPAQMARELREENKLLLSQLHQVQEELESHFMKVKTAEEQLEQANIRIKELTEQAAQTSQLADMEEENELLLHQLHHVQEELESYYLQSQDSERQLADCRNELSQINDQLNIANSSVNALRNSLSWKITSPLRAVFGLFSGGKQKAQA